MIYLKVIRKNVLYKQYLDEVVIMVNQIYYHLDHIFNYVFDNNIVNHYILLNGFLIMMINIILISY